MAPPRTDFRPPPPTAAHCSECQRDPHRHNERAPPARGDTAGLNTFTRNTLRHLTRRRIRDMLGRHAAAWTSSHALQMSASRITIGGRSGRLTDGRCAHSSPDRSPAIQSNRASRRHATKQGSSYQRAVQKTFGPITLPNATFLIMLKCMESPLPVTKRSRLLDWRPLQCPAPSNMASTSFRLDIFRSMPNGA